MRERPESVHERRAARRTGSMTARANSIHADGLHARPRAVPPRRLGVRGEGRRLAHPGVQGRRPRPLNQQEWPRPHAPVPQHPGGHREVVRSLVLDGEIAIFDQELRSRFDWLREPDHDAIATPPMFMVFDLLHHDRRELTGRPLRERRSRLEDVVADNDLVLSVRRLASDGMEAWKQVIERRRDHRSRDRLGTARSLARGDKAGADG